LIDVRRMITMKKYEEPLMEVIELVTRDVFMSASGGEPVIPGIGGGGGFGEDNGEEDGF
jgi:hypothetical protein